MPSIDCVAKQDLLSPSNSIWWAVAHNSLACVSLFIAFKASLAYHFSCIACPFFLFAVININLLFVHEWPHWNRIQFQMLLPILDIELMKPMHSKWLKSRLFIYANSPEKWSIFQVWKMFFSSVNWLAAQSNVFFGFLIERNDSPT